LRLSGSWRTEPYTFERVIPSSRIGFPDGEELSVFANAAAFESCFVGEGVLSDVVAEIWADIRLFMGVELSGRGNRLTGVDRGCLEGTMEAEGAWDWVAKSSRFGESSVVYLYKLRSTCWIVWVAIGICTSVSIYLGFLPLAFQNSKRMKRLISGQQENGFNIAVLAYGSSTAFSTTIFEN
jgi:hypothetical protein